MELDGILRELLKIPTISRFLCASTFALTFSVILQVAFFRTFVYSYYEVFQEYRLWKLWSCFFVGTPKLELVYELLMLHGVSATLELGPYAQRSADYAWQMFFAAIGIFAATRPLHSSIFLHPLIVCLGYLCAATAPVGSETSLMGFVTVPISYLPYGMIAIRLLMGGPYGAAQAVAGALVGHLWFWGVWKGRGTNGGVLAEYGRAPQWFRNALGEKGPRPPMNGGGLKREGRAGQHIKLDVLRPAGSCCGASTSASVNMWSGVQTLGGRR